MRAVVTAPPVTANLETGWIAMSKCSMTHDAMARMSILPQMQGRPLARNIKPVLRIATVLLAAGILTACQSVRFGGPPVQRGVVQDLEPVAAAPSGIVMAEPLGEPGRERFDDFPRLDARFDREGDRQQTAALSQPAPQRARVTRTSFVGSWNASEPGGGTCRVTLSSTPALDLYRASASGCSNQEIASVNAWDLRGSEIYLYQQGGAVAARLQATPGNMTGAIAKSGAPLTMSR